MADINIPTHNKYIDYIYQKNNIGKYIDPRIQLSRASNEIIKQVGNDIVLNGLDVKNIHTVSNEKLIIDICKGNLIQDLTFINIIDDFSLSLDLDPELDFSDGIVVVYTHFKYSDSSQDNKLYFYINYLSNSLPIISDWDHKYNKIVIAAFNKCSLTNEFVLNFSPKYIINNNTYYYKGHVNYNLVDISDNWSTYLDYFGNYNILEYKNHGNLLHEFNINILNNDYYDIDIKDKYDVNRLMIDFNCYDNSLELYDFECYTQCDFINIEKNNDYVRIYNNDSVNKVLAITFLDNMNNYYEKIYLVDEYIFDLDLCFPGLDITHDQVVVQCFDIYNNKHVLNNNINISKYDNKIKVINNDIEKDLYVIIGINLISDINTIVSNSYIDYNINQIFEDQNISELGIYADVYILQEDFYIKNNLLDIIKFNSHIRIYNNTDNDITFNILFSSQSSTFMKREKCNLDELLYTQLSLNKIGNGNGILNSGDFNCGDTCNDIIVQKNQKIKIEAIADPDSIFTNWNGCDYFEDNICYVRCNKKRLVTATFLKKKQISIIKHGNGNIYSSPIGIDDQNLIASFIKNTSVILIGEPENSEHNIKWSINGNEIINNIYTITDLTDDIILNVYFGDFS